MCDLPADEKHSRRNKGWNAVPTFPTTKVTKVQKGKDYRSYQSQSIDSALSNKLSGRKWELGGLMIPLSGFLNVSNWHRHNCDKAKQDVGRLLLVKGHHSVQIRPIDDFHRFGRARTQNKQTRKIKTKVSALRGSNRVMLNLNGANGQWVTCDFVVFKWRRHHCHHNGEIVGQTY